MSTFLQAVAEHYYRRYGSEISRLHFVFPSRRAMLFFRHYLSQIAIDPIFAPECSTINDFFASLVPQGYKLADHTTLQFELYEAYREVYPDAESFDAFLYWGGIILKDFDQIDRHLISARALYANVYDYKELADELEYLSDELRALIEQFWGKFRDMPQDYGTAKADGYTDSMREKFLQFWSRLYPLYEAFGRRLREQGILYEGALYREVASEVVDIVDSIADGGRLIFVGLFYLTESEKKLFRQIRRRDIGEFCWDRRVRIVQDEQHPAHKLLLDNIEMLGQVEIEDSNSHALPEQVNLVRCNSSLAQVKALPNILDMLDIDGAELLEPTTAILLPDESLLLPAVSSIPPSFDGINISLGYPLAQAPVAIFVDRWMRLLESERIIREKQTYPYEPLIGLLGTRLLREYAPGLLELTEDIKAARRYYVSLDEHQGKIESLGLTDICSTLLPSSHERTGLHLLDAMYRLLRGLLPTNLEEDIEEQDEAEAFLEEETSASNEDTLSDLDIEFIYHYLNLITRLRSQLEKYEQLIDLHTAIQLLRGLIEGINIPFEGNPLKGLQIMGLLETRGIHCEHLIYLSAEEGKLPKPAITTTLIPLTLRQGYGLPTPQELEIAGAYNFYQSIARAESLTLLYGSEGGLGSGAEQSRYIQQLRYLYDVEMREFTLSIAAEQKAGSIPIVHKEGYVWELLEQYRQTKELSPSSLSIYASCPLRFYYEHIERLQSEEAPSLLLQANEFGTIVHNVMQELYRVYEGGRVVSREDIQNLLHKSQQARLETLVERFYRELLPDSARRGELSQLAKIYCDLMLSQVKTVLRYDRDLAPFTYHAGEQRIHLPVILSDGREVRFKGTIDRIDETTDGLRVVDYKTGSAELRLRYWEELFSPEGKYKAIAQTLIYSELLSNGHQDNGQKALPSLSHKPIAPHIYHLPSMSKPGKAYQSVVSVPDNNSESTKATTQPIVDYMDCRADFLDELMKTLEELFSPDVPFVAQRGKGCSYCPFLLSCGKE